MGFQQGLSGLNASSRSLDVIGNNIANASTVGFKNSRAEFADVYASTALGGSRNSIGIGVDVARVRVLYTQGNLTTTTNPFDIAIQGEGFFRMENNGTVKYSRNGQFTVDKDGYIVNNYGERLTGYSANAEGTRIIPAQPSALKLAVDTASPQTTKVAEQNVNLDSTAPAINIGLHPFTLDPNSGPNPDAYSWTTSITVFDSLGNTHVASAYYAKRGPNQWDLYMTRINEVGQHEFVTLGGDAAAGTIGTTPQTGTTPIQVAFDTNGQLVTVTPPGGVPAPGNVFTLGFPPGTGASDVVFTYDLSQSIQFNAQFANNTQIQDGFTSGRLTGFSVADDGIITAVYSNGQTKKQGQIALGTFSNPNGLVPVGRNDFLETAESGQARLGPPGTSNLGTVRSMATEDSTVDLTQELVNMIIAQRVYQANSQTIKTQDSIMQTIVNLR